MHFCVCASVSILPSVYSWPCMLHLSNDYHNHDTEQVRHRFWREEYLQTYAHTVIPNLLWQRPSVSDSVVQKGNRFGVLLGNCSVSKVPAAQGEDLSLDLHKQPGMMTHACNPRAWEAETGGPPELAATKYSWISEFQIQWGTLSQNTW